MTINDQPFENPFADLAEHNRSMSLVTEKIKRDCPGTYRLFFGTRFQLPNPRQNDYPHHANASLPDALGVVATAVSQGKQDPSSEDEEALSACFTSVNAWVNQGMTTLFLERELAEALMRTDLPEGFVPSDIHWRRNAFRLFLPKGLFVVNTPQGPLEPTCLTVARYFKDQAIPLDPRMKRDLITIMEGYGLPVPKKEMASWSDRERVMISIQMRPQPEFMGAVDYYTDCPLDDRSLTEIAQETVKYSQGRLDWNLEEKTFLTQVKHLVLNVILFMGSFPQEYSTERILRPFHEKKGRWKAELKEARFLGQELYRPKHRPETAHEHAHTGRRLPGHYRAGHWKRQVYGPGNSQRKLIWVQLYRTTGLDSDQNAA